MRFSLGFAAALGFLIGTFSSGASATPSLSLTSETAQGMTSGFTNGMSGFSSDLSFSYGVLSATGPGSVTYTYLGSEAGYNNSFVSNFTFYNHSFSNGNATAIGSSVTQNVSQAGALNFAFSTQSPSYTVTDAQNLQSNPNGAYGLNQGVFGIVKGATVANNRYQYVLIYNDPVNGGDHDYNDMVVGVNFKSAVSPAPEPETYAMMMAGLGLLGFMARRKNLK